jgi:hypothetical protein
MAIRTRVEWVVVLVMETPLNSAVNVRVLRAAPNLDRMARGLKI